MRRAFCAKTASYARLVFRVKHCSQCFERFAGENSESCSLRFSGPDCGQCAERFAVKTVNSVRPVFRATIVHNAPSVSAGENCEELLITFFWQRLFAMRRAFCG